MTTAQQDRVDETAAGEPPRRHDRGLIAAAAVVIVAALYFTLTSALNGDVTYAFGGIQTAGLGEVNVWHVFIARPIAYRLVIDWLDHGRALIVSDPSSVLGQNVVRLETDVVVLAIGVVLYLGLRRSLPRMTAASTAVAVTAALMIAPPWHFLEPDWVAVLGGVLAVGCALAPRRIWVGAALGGVIVVSTLAVKLATAPIGLLALLLIAAVSLRRAAWTAGVAAVVTAIWYALSGHFLPWEATWLHDQASLVAQSPIHHAPRWADIANLLHALGDVIVLSPVVAVAPAAAVALIRCATPGRSRWIWSGFAVLAAALSVASGYGQGEWFMYQFAIVPVLAAAVWGTAYGLAESARVPLIVGLVAVTTATAVLIYQPVEWRTRHVHLVDAGYLALALAVAVWVALADGSRSRRWAHSGTWRPPRWAPLAGAVVVCIAMLPATAPHSPYAFSSYDAGIANAPQQAVPSANIDTLNALSARLGHDTPVLYLTFGSVNFAMGNPTNCRYPSPQWAQRGVLNTSVRGYRSYADNLVCFTHDQQARYLIWDTQWFPLQWAPQPIKGLIAEQFDCSAAAQIPAPKGLTVCPRRTPPN